MAEPHAQRTRPDHMTWRHWLLASAISLALLALLGRLAWIQIANHEHYTELAAASRADAELLPAPRGAILDASGHPLAISVDTWDLYIDSFLWRDRERAGEAAVALGSAMGLDAATLFEMGISRENGDVIVQRFIDYERGLALRERGIWGVRLLPSSQRVYAEQELAGPLIGYVGLDGSGLWGIERDFDPVLRGQPGLLLSERDALGRPIAFAASGGREPTVGGEVQLTIDRFIQAIAEQRLAEAVEANKASGGTVIVMEPRSGAILAMASLPSISLADVDLDDEQVLDLARNRAVSDLYEPGSVFKTLTTATAIDLGLITPQTTYVDEGWVHVGGHTIRNWDFTGYGEVTMTEFLRRSLNTGSIWISQQIGAERFYEYLDRFGVGQPTHIELSGEAPGMLRRVGDPDWYAVDLATHSYGQGLAATPLQVISAVNSFATGGLLMRPQIVHSVVASDGVRVHEPVVIRRTVSPETAHTVARMMLEVVEGVPWHLARVEGYRVAGKTGTTIVTIAGGYDPDTTIASFVGFLPYEDPRVTILVKIDEPRGDSNLAGIVAAPVFSTIAAEIMEYLRVPPGERQVSNP
ncbi:MAG: penicillin-binding protein 2 [Chloroflexi bacterium]|nr:penicillin-binding protein 2 [Chloroflexota bacterium]